MPCNAPLQTRPAAGWPWHSCGDVPSSFAAGRSREELACRCQWRRSATGGRVSESGWELLRRDRLVKNELSFRDYNNRRAALEQQAVAIEPNSVEESVPFVCECGSADCVGALMVTIDE